MKADLMNSLRTHWFVYLLLLTGCAGLGLTVAKTFDERLAYAVGQHTAIQRATAQSLNDHAISSADAEAVLKMADDSKPFLSGARIASEVGDTSAADAKLRLATTALTALQTYLRERSK